MKTTLKKILSLILILVLGLSIVACGKKPAPVDEDVSSLSAGEEIVSEVGKDEAVDLIADVESAIVEAPKSEEIQEEIRLENSKEIAAESTVAEPKSSPVSENSTLVSEISTPSTFEQSSSKVEETIFPEQFEQPPEDRVREHSEHSMEDFVAWLNSEEALTEEDGAFADAVNFYRKRGSFPWAFASDPKQNVRWYKLYSNGTLESFFDNQGSITILPFSTDKAEAAKGGIVSYLKAEGNSVVQTNRGTDFAAITRENPDYYVRRDFTRNSKQIEAVYRINRLELLHQNTGELERVDFRPVLYWIQDGFCVEMGFAFGTTAEEAWNYDQEFVSSLSFREVALSASPLQAAK